MNSSDTPTSEFLTSESRYRSFALLVADWVWELDANLQYVFHDGSMRSLTGLEHGNLTGQCRIDSMNEWVQPSVEIDEHHRALRAHERVDVIVPSRHTDGSTVYSHIIAEPLFDSDGTFTGYVGCGRDVTDSVTLKEQLAHLARHDDLTGVFNRREFEKRLWLLRDAVQGTDYQYALCFIDLDRFKLVNDTAGHPAGDQLLKELTAIMRHHVRPVETLARLGGDEFGMLLEMSCEQAQRLAEQVIQDISQHEFIWESSSYNVGACVGITPVSDGCGSVEELLARADSACYAAKNAGRNQSFVFALDSVAYHEHRMELDQVSMIKEALKANRFRLLMQPIEPARVIPGSSRHHHEVLLRLECEDGTMMSPAGFIPLAERFDVMHDLDRWVVENSLAALRRFRSNGSDMSLAINLSGNTLSDKSSLDEVIDLVEGGGVPGRYICFEITETSAIRNLDLVANFMRSLQKMNVQFALDDFGAGLSSFAYLKSLPINYLKIDGSFIKNITEDPASRAITSAFNQLSHELNIKTIAEFVENQEVRDCVAELGIDFVQGYGIGKPVDLMAALWSMDSQMKRVSNG